MSGNDTDGKANPDGNGTSEPVPHVALVRGTTRPPAKPFVSKPFSARSLMAGAPRPSSPLIDRLHGRGPLVKWPRSVSSRGADMRAESKGGNMSERFISERLLSDRGSTSFNPQIPRRVPDIPSPASVKAGEADIEGKRLVIGRAITLSGEIAGCERLLVEGKVQATLREVKMLEVGANGSFSGTATVDSASVAGTFEGTLQVSGHLEIGPGATVKGTVSYGTIAVANGGKLLGTVESA
jgi:cytoskeletal protein CcmA (bactofilin family)